jgi:phosphatidylglycerophosphatase A
MKLTQPIWPRFLPSNLVLNFATLGPVGRRRRAPGTWGSVAGMLYFTVFFWPLGFWPVSAVWTLLFSLPGLYLAVAICGEAEFRLGRRDPGEVILDEFASIPLCFLGWPQLARALPGWASPWLVFLTGFVLFRVFDILKPLGIRQLQDLPGGWGIVIDDVAAALATCAVMHLAAWGARMH